MTALRIFGGAVAALAVMYVLVVSLWAIFPPPELVCIAGQTLDTSGTTSTLPTVCSRP